MKRRTFVQYAGLSALSAAIANLAAPTVLPSYAQAGGSVTIKSLGHTCFLFTGSGRSILVNPFRSIGCTAGYREPNVAADLVMISSRLFDEGVVSGLPGDPRVLGDTGIYEFQNMQVQGIATDHDRFGGRRFGTNVVWRWNQGGLNILHMGGAAAPVTLEQQILMGRPDVLLIPVGGRVKAYNAQEAKATIELLNPKIVIPTHYRTAAADAESCDVSGLDEFLALMGDVPIRRSTDSTTLSPASLPGEGLRVEVIGYAF